MRAQEKASVESFHFGIGIAVVLVGLGGVLGFAGIRNPRRVVAAEGCAGGQFVGVPEDASRQSPCDWHRDLPVVTLPPREQHRLEVRRSARSARRHVLPSQRAQACA